MLPDFKIKQVEYHRNGVGGNGFYAVLFSEGRGAKTRNFLASVFEEAGNVSVICLDLLPEHGVTFGANSWRGDQYERDLRSAIEAHEAARAA